MTNEKQKDLDYMPNQKWHQITSFIKSSVRIVGYALLFVPELMPWAAGVLIASEVVGIVEEMV